METLEELGYVARSASDERFRVTFRAQQLGDGFDTDLRICETVGPILAKLGQCLVWPIDFSIHNEGQMVVEETTHRRSPLALDHSVIGRRLPILRTAAGRAYLAYCPDGERQLIVEHLRSRNEPEDQPFLDGAVLDRLIRTTKERGYAVRNGEQFIPKTSSLGIPILAHCAVLGAVTVIWITNSLTLAEAVEQFLGPMRDAATEIASHHMTASAYPDD